MADDLDDRPDSVLSLMRDARRTMTPTVTGVNVATSALLAAEAELRRLKAECQRLTAWAMSEQRRYQEAVLLVDQLRLQHDE